jgi:hypothetical protein
MRHTVIVVGSRSREKFISVDVTESNTDTNWCCIMLLYAMHITLYGWKQLSV